ncbi:Zinc finger rsv2 [Lecanosticta acicola]|uniref:Zinc finger rsv2 n=1 Tax=Lecanosticta acicola TaxID=111012 RepID=A0AAI8W1W2_9PEZI|nr:Zinc finger rsv2 [Lecanosticta acicola]
MASTASQNFNSTARPFSSTTNSRNVPVFHNTSHPTSNTTTTTFPFDDFELYEPAVYHKALTILQQSANSDTTESFPNPRTRLHNPTPTTAASQNGFAVGGGEHQTTSGGGVSNYDWPTSMYHPHLSHNSMGGPVAAQNKGVKRARSHQRTPSASTIGSNGPASPYMSTGSYPGIVNSDFAPRSPAYYADQGLPKHLPTPSQTPTDSAFSNAGYISSQAAHLPNAHLAMKDFGMNHHNPEDYNPDFAPPSRQSMSSYGNDSPATPQSGVGDDQKQYSLPQNGELEADRALDMLDYLLFVESDYNQPQQRQNNPNVQLFRTESQAYQDELYNPNAMYNPQPAKASNSYLSPNPRNLINERLQTANLARSASPASAMSRERSPFRDGSPLAPSKDWRSQGAPVGTAASMRQQQKQEAADAEYAQHRVQLRREPTKTISPKDAVLEYNESDQPSLFQDSIPAGYERHLGGTEQWPTNNYMAPASSFGDLSMNGQQSMSFRNATSADTGYSATGFDFPRNLPQGPEQMQSNPFQSNYQNAAKMNEFAEQTPAFPASIPSMETSHSDAGVPPSSQDSSGQTSMPQRPDDTRANTGTYTCTYHGCSQRFESHGSLQKHKRDYHRSQQQIKDNASTSGTGSASPRSTESPAPSTSGMTSAAILARNSQAGPHKCTRINPSTGKPCSTIFSRPYDLTRHEDTIHNNRKQKVRCPMCREEKTFSRNDALTRHMRVVHPEVEAFGKRGRRD